MKPQLSQLPEQRDWVLVLVFIRDENEMKETTKSMNFDKT